MAKATRFSRRIPPGVRMDVYRRSDGKCQKCGDKIEFDRFHVSHLRAAANGGPAIPSNLEAWCVSCNLKQGRRDVRDTRVALRPWQQDALPLVLEALTMKKVATVMAAPGGGKTIFAAATFIEGQEAGLWSRLLVVVPRLPLVKQWERGLKEACHIGLDIKTVARQGGHEMGGMDGVCCTYQALLSVQARQRHRDAARVPTLVVLDEVHHLGQPINSEGADTAAWSNAIKEVVGDLQSGLNVAGVLNLSGTLFRTSPKERISTVEYEDTIGDHGEQRIQALTDYAIHPERLVREGFLRAPDLYRVGATVELIDLQNANVVESRIADLNDDASRRLALRRLNLRPEWIEKMVSETLDQLQARHRDSKGSPVKALIVAHRQEMAQDFANEVNRQMRSRKLLPIADCVVSDHGADGYRRLEEFRLKKQPGVLCTVGMAGEGYDCADICVVAYATNVLTAQYIRQVVARGQRVTNWEREKVGHPLTTAIILPDIQDLVDEFTAILAPMVHDIEVPAVPPASPEDRAPRGDATPAWSSKDLISVRDAELAVVSAVSTSGTIDVDPALQNYLPEILAKLDLPESLWPRMAGAIDLLNKQRPFEQPILTKPVTAVGVLDRPEPKQRELTPRELHDALRKQLTRVRGWWVQIAAKNGGQLVSHVESEIKQEVGITQIDTATIYQLQRAHRAWMTRIRTFCGNTGTALPKFVRLADSANDE